MTHNLRRRASDQFRLQDVVRHLRANPRKWFIPTAICVALAMGYALFRSPTWQATQTVLIRNEAAANNDAGLGRFRDLDEMKVSQETIIEVIQSPDVLRRALASVDGVDPASIDDESVNDLRDAMETAPPDGAELGKTEIIYVRVKDKDQQRALQMATAISHAAQHGLRQLREAKLTSMVQELTHSAEVCDGDLNVARGELAQLEGSLGGDLAELRALDGSGASEGELHRRLNSLDDELRQAHEAQRANDGLLSLLQAAQSDPASFLATPNRLLESQPALRRLKDGLVDAQLRHSQILGSMTARHPLALAAQTEVDEIKSNLHGELQIAIRGVQVEMGLTSQRIDALMSERDALNNRLSGLAGMRSEYSALVANVNHSTTLSEDAHRKLSAARASLAGVDAASLLTLVDEARLAPRPIGPGRTMITILGLFGGLAVGLAYTFFTMPVSPPSVAAAGAAVGPLAKSNGHSHVGRNGDSHKTNGHDSNGHDVTASFSGRG